MTDDIVLLYGETKLPADDCKVIFKDKFKKEHEVEISRLIQVFNNNIWENKKECEMNCWHCEHELIWGGDHDTEDNEDYDIVSNLSCPKCHAAVDVWHPSEKLIKEYKDHE